MSFIMKVIFTATIIASVLLLLIIPISSQAQNIDPYPPGPYPDRIILSWSESPSTTQSVTWRTDVSVKNAVAEIAIANPSPDFRREAIVYQAETELLVTNNNAAHFHSVTFTDLLPDTMYIYRVGVDKCWSEWFQFETASIESEPFSFLYFGDAQNDVKSMWSRCIRQAYSTLPDIDFLIHAGDLINKADNDTEWGEWFYAGGWIYGMKPNIACPGNHEYYFNSGNKRHLSKHWKANFTFPENGPEGLEETVYYIDYQGTRFISLNTQAMYLDTSLVAVQRKWLDKVLKRNTNRWTIVIQHHPVYSTKFGRDNPEIRAAFQPLYEKHGVDLVLQGHDHTYGRGYNVHFGEDQKKKKSNEKGPIYVVSVSGPKMYDLNFDDWVDRVASNTQLYQIIKVDSGRIMYEAYTTTGQKYDSFVLLKQDDGSNIFMELAPKNVPEITTIPRYIEQHMSADEIKNYQQRFKDYAERKRKAASFSK